MNELEALSTLFPDSKSPRVKIVYTNYRGETRVRDITPIRMYYGATDYHPERQFLLLAMDNEKQEERHFAMTGIKEWSEVND